MANKRRTTLKRLRARIKRRLRAHLRKLGFLTMENGMLEPPSNHKDTFRLLHRSHRFERLRSERAFIKDKLPKLLNDFASGSDVIPARIQPRLQLVESGTREADLFRLASLTWSVPVSQGYGRRMRFLVWDESNHKLVGIIALGDPVFNLRVRDALIGWTADQRRDRLVDVMDAYVVGAVPPYNMLLGGKLVASLIRTREVRDLFAKRYAESRGIISGKKKHASLAVVTTSSALGRSSMYNRLQLGGIRYFDSIGYTSGWGHFHIPDDLFEEMRQYLKRKHHTYADNHQFGDGPNWRLRLVRVVLEEAGMNSDLLRHGIMREVFICRLASNADRVLMGEVDCAVYRNLLSVDQVGRLALERWIIPRSLRRPEFEFWKREQIPDLLRPVAVARLSDVRPSRGPSDGTDGASSVLVEHVLRKNEPELLAKSTGRTL